MNDNADEMEQGVKALAERSFELHECQKQLDAERALREKITLSWTLSKSDNEKLRHQLAAEREKTKQANTQCRTLGALMQDAHKEAEQLIEQLAAERVSHEKELDVIEQNWRDELTAERENGRQEAWATGDRAIAQEYIEKIEKLKQQLYAEREKVKQHIAAILDEQAHYASLNEDFTDSQQQLAAERELRKRWERKTEETLTQLAAERKEWQLATEECHRIISRKNDELASERESTVKEWTVENDCIVTRRTEEDTRMFVFPKETSPDLLDSICETHNRSVSILCGHAEKAAARAELAQIALAAERKVSNLNKN